MRIYHLVGRETSNPRHTYRQEFSLQFCNLSPYAVKEVLDLTDAQETRFFRCYEVTKQLMRSLHIFPRERNRDDEQALLDLDEFDHGYPRMTLSYLLDTAQAFLHFVEKKDGNPELYNPEFASNINRVMEAVRAAGSDSHPGSWRALISRLWRLHKLKVFDNPRAPALNYADLIRPGQVSIIDLSDTQSPQLNNLVIADLLRGVQQEQERMYQQYEQGRGELPKVLIIIEEAHEFLSSERIDKMPILFEQVARIAKRGRKRWLGLVFVTQLPQHLPRQVLGLVNNYILHKITDPVTISALQNAISGIDDSQWQRLPGLAPGQAIVSFTHMTRPLLTAIYPSPCKLRMVD